LDVARARAVPVFAVMAGRGECGEAPVSLPGDLNAEWPPRNEPVGRVPSRSLPSRDGGSSRAPAPSQLRPPPTPVPSTTRRKGPEALESSRWALQRIAADSGGLVLTLRSARNADEVWRDVERALERVWVAVFEPSEPAVQSRSVTVRSSRGTLLRPSD